jgi:hypothetical protein
MDDGGFEGDVDVPRDKTLLVVAKQVHVVLCSTLHGTIRGVKRQKNEVRGNDNK